MVRRRNPTPPPIRMPFWKKDGKLWYAERADLVTAIAKAERSEEDIKRIMGVGYIHLLDALDGKRIEGWSVVHIETGIRPESEIKPLKSHST